MSDENTKRETIDSLIRHQQELRILTDVNSRMMAEISTLKSSLAAELRRQSQELEIMNARVAVDAKSYERDQYLIAALRKQLAALAKPAPEKP